VQGLELLGQGLERNRSGHFYSVREPFL
jgi:hypothetical protein